MGGICLKETTSDGYKDRKKCHFELLTRLIYICVLQHFILFMLAGNFDI